MEAIEDPKDRDVLGEHLELKSSNVDKPLPTNTVVFVYDAELEKRILRKVDLRLVPAVWFMSILNYLDRGNLGNAKSAGMETDLGLSSSDYSLAVSIFFVGYLLLQVPSNMILVRSKPRLYLSALELLWGAMCLAFVGVKTKGGLYALRLCLGIIEAGFFPGVLVYMSAWYRKAELTRRWSLFVTAAWFSGAFSGLLAGAIIKGLSGKRGLPAWKWLFLIEGVFTIFFALCTPLILPDFPANTTWLKPHEREYWMARLAADDNADTEEEASLTPMQAFLSAVKDWRMWLFCFMQSLIAAAGTISFFIPTLVSALGYSGSMAQYMTVPIYAVAIVFVVAICFSSDHFQERPKHLMLMAGLAVVFIAIVAGVDSPKPRYVFMCLGVSCVWAASPVHLTYLSNTISHPTQKRAVVIALINGLSNVSSIYGSYIWPSSSAPEYIPGFVTVTCFMFGVFTAAGLSIYLFKKYPYPESRFNVIRAENEDTSPAH